MSLTRSPDATHRPPTHHRSDRRIPATLLAAVGVVTVLVALTAPVSAAPPERGSPAGFGAGSVRLTNIVAGVPPVLDRHFVVAISSAADGTCSPEPILAFDFADAGSQVQDDVAPGLYCVWDLDAPSMPIVSYAPAPTFAVFAGVQTDLTVTHAYTDPAVGRNANVYVTWADQVHEDDDPSSFGIDVAAYVLHLTVLDGVGSVVQQLECRYDAVGSLCDTFALPIGGRLLIAQDGLAGFTADRTELTVADCALAPSCVLILTNRAAEPEPPSTTTPIPTTVTTTGVPEIAAPPTTASPASMPDPGQVPPAAGVLADVVVADPAAGPVVADAGQLPQTGAGDLLLGVAGSMLVLGGAIVVLAARRHAEPR